MNRSQLVIDNFDEKFKKYKDQKILIYGKGLYTKLLIERYSNYSFVGIIDRLDLDGCYCGIPVLKYEDVISSKADIIIIAASDINTKHIRSRIANFCVRNSIQLYSIDGKRLNIDDGIIQVDKNWDSIDQFCIEDLIGLADTICFELNSLIVDYGIISCKRFFMRNQLIDAVKYAISQKKQVVMLIDEYTSDKFRFFKERNYNFFDKLDIYEIKELGYCNIFMKIKKKYLKEKLIYIGKEGIELARLSKISTYPVYPLAHMINFTTFKELKNIKLLPLEKIYYTEIVKKIFNGSHIRVKEQKIFIQEAYDIGYIFLGPIITDFLHWFINKLKEYKIEEVIFSSRDGYFIQKLYNFVKSKKNVGELPGSKYLYISRLVGNLANIYDVCDIENQINKYFKGSSLDMLKNRFMLDEDVLLKKSKKNCINEDINIKYYYDDILVKAAQVRNGYKKYIYEQKIDLHDRIAFFDLFASGTCQLSLTKLTNKNYKGLYFSRLYDRSKTSLDIENFLDSNAFMEDHSIFIESIITSFEPTLNSVDPQGNLKFGHETRTDEELNYVREVQNGIFAFVSNVFDICGNELIEYDKFSKKIFSMIVSKYTQIDNDIFKDMVIRDETLNRYQYLGDFYKY